MPSPSGQPLKASRSSTVRQPLLNVDTQPLSAGAIPIRSMSIDQVSQWLEKIGFSQFVAKFRENGVDGELLAELQAPELAPLGFNPFEAKKLAVNIRRLTQSGFVPDVSAG